MNRIGTKSDTIWFTSDSDPLHFSTRVCVYTEQRDNFVRGALRGLLREAVVFPSFRNHRNVLSAIFFCPLTMQSDPKFFVIPSFFFESNFALKDVYISSGPWSVAAKRRGKLWAEVPRYVFAFHMVLFNKEHFLWPFAFQICQPASKVSG